MVYDHASRDSFDPSRTARAFGSDDDDDDDDDATRIAREASPSRPPSSNASIAPNAGWASLLRNSSTLTRTTTDADAMGRGGRTTHRDWGQCTPNTHVTCPLS